MTSEALLLELKDIAAPAPPGWWLLAPGQLVILLLVAVSILGGWLWYRQRRSAQRVNLARLELERIRLAHEARGDTLYLSRDLSRWLKQVAMLAFPDRQLAAMHGSDWLRFLDEILGDSSFTRGEGRVFAEAIYQRQLQQDAHQILALCERWLQAIKPRLRQKGGH